MLGPLLGVAVVVMVGCSAPVPVAEHPTGDRGAITDDEPTRSPIATGAETPEVAEPGHSETEEAPVGSTEPTPREGGSLHDDPVVTTPRIPDPIDPVEAAASVDSRGSVPAQPSIGPSLSVDAPDAGASSAVADRWILNEQPARTLAAPVPPVPAEPPSPSSSPSRNAAAPAQPVVVERGHVDLVEVSLDNGRLRLSSKDHTTPGGPTFRAPADIQLRVKDKARTKIPPAEEYRFLGPPESTIWLLPQTEDPELVWPGWSTERLRAGQVVGDKVTWRLLDVKGPGVMALFTTNQFGSPSVIFSSRGGVPNETTIRVNTHAHGNWAFTEPGAYQLTFEVAADVLGVGPTASRATWVVLVGDSTAVVAPAEVPAAETGVQPTRPPSTAPGTGAGGAASAAGRDNRAFPNTMGAAPPTEVAGTSQTAVGGSGIGALPLTGAVTVPLGVVGAAATLLGCGLLRLHARGRDRISRAPRHSPSHIRAR